MGLGSSGSSSATFKSGNPHFLARPCSFPAQAHWGPGWDLSAAAPRGPASPRWSRSLAGDRSVKVHPQLPLGRGERQETEEEAEIRENEEGETKEKERLRDTEGGGRETGRRERLRDRGGGTDGGGRDSETEETQRWRELGSHPGGG